MNRFHMGGILSVGVVAATALVLTAGTASAQAKDASSNGNATTEQVEVIAPAHYHREVDRDRNGLPERINLSHAIAAQKSDLRTAAGARQLKIRVHTDAYQICQQLARQVPYTVDEQRTCYQKAVRHGMHEAEAAIEQASYSASQ